MKHLIRREIPIPANPEKRGPLSPEQAEPRKRPVIPQRKPPATVPIPPEKKLPIPQKVWKKLSLLYLLAVLAISFPSCSGKVVGDERNNWLPALTTISPAGSIRAGSAYAGLDRDDLYGFNSYYGKPLDIPKEVSETEKRTLGLILSFVENQVFLQDSPALYSVLGNDVVMFMNDRTTWPNAIYGEGLASSYGFQVLDTGGNTISDCYNGPCVFKDVIAINNRTGLVPSADTLDGLPPSELKTLMELAGSLSEEMLHDYFRQGLAEEERFDFCSKVKSLWKAGSSGEEDDRKMMDIWKGGIALAASGSALKGYKYQEQVVSAIAEGYPLSSPAERNKLEAAVISYLQLIGEYANSFVGSPGRSYHEYYARMDAANGIPEKSREQYSDKFIDRESYPHIGKYEEDRRVFPAFFRQYFSSLCRSSHLDRTFSGGHPDPVFSENPYLADYDMFLQVVAKVVPNLLLKI